MSNKVINSSGQASIPEKRKNPCSLLRVFSMIAVGAAIILGRQVSQKAEPTITYIRRDQIPRNFECGPGPLEPYFGSTRVLGEPIPSATYPSRIQHPGLVMTGKGLMGYVIGSEKLRNEHLERVKVMEMVYAQVADDPRVVEAVAAVKGQDNKGFEVAIPKGTERDSYLFALNPAKLENHKKATLEVQSWIGELGDLSETTICEKILQAHTTLMSGLGSLEPGKYRTQGGIVYKDDAEDQDRTLEGLTKLVYQRSPNGEKKKNVKIFREQIVPKINQIDGLPQNLRSILSLIGFVPPSSREIPHLMKEYAKNLKSMAKQMKYCEEFDPVGFASFAHQQFGRIHPFADGNGRMARLIMNGILTQAGYRPVVFQTDKAYTEAVSRDSFADYLRETAIPWTESQLGGTGPCLPDLSCE